MEEQQEEKFGRRVLWGVTFAVIGVAILAIIVGPAILTSPARPPVVKIYYADNISPAHQEIVRRFNERYRNRYQVITVHLPFTRFSTNERKELLARALRSKSDRIDVFSVDVIWVPRFAKWGEPLDAYFTHADRARLLPYALTSCYYQGRLMAVPLYLDIGLMYYRKDLLQQLPDWPALQEKVQRSISWEEFLAAFERWSPKTSPYYLFAADNYEGLICSFVEGVMSLGDSLVDAEGRIRVNTPAARRSLQLLADLVHRYRATPPKVVFFDEILSYMYALDHNAIFFRGWPGFLLHYREQIERTAPLSNFGLAPLPHFAGGRPAFVFGGWNLMISRFSRNGRAALTFVRFLLEEQNQKILYETSGYIPVLQSIYADTSFLAAHPDLSLYRRLMEHGVHRPYIERYTQVSDILSYYANLAIRGEMSVAEALEKAQAAIFSNQFVLK
ncbi:MAG: extracellular solute-binding protein [candidate division KSB1 bacterium]|nr:extracellular solute-binding protein [candidate division KSB1 bacterium]